MDEIRENNPNRLAVYAAELEKSIPQSEKFLNQRYNELKVAGESGTLNAKAKAALATFAISIIAFENLRNNQYPAIRTSVSKGQYKYVLSYERQRVTAAPEVKKYIDTLAASPENFNRFMEDPHNALQGFFAGKTNPAPNYADAESLKQVKERAANLSKALRSVPEAEKYSDLCSKLEAFNPDKELATLSSPEGKSLAVRDKAYESISSSVSKLVKALKDSEKTLPAVVKGKVKTNLNVTASNLIGLMQNVVCGAEHARGLTKSNREMTAEEKTAAKPIVDSLNAMRAQCIFADDALKGYTDNLRRFLNNDIGSEVEKFNTATNQLNPSPRLDGIVQNKNKKMDGFEYQAYVDRMRYSAAQIQEKMGNLTALKNEIMNLDNQILRPLEDNITLASEKMKNPDFAADPQNRKAVKESVSASLEKAMEKLAALKVKMDKEPETVPQIAKYYTNLEKKLQSFVDFAQVTKNKLDLPENADISASAENNSKEADAWDKLIDNVDKLANEGAKKATNHFEIANAHFPERRFKGLSGIYSGMIRSVTGEILNHKLTDVSRRSLTMVVAQFVSDRNTLYRDAMLKQYKATPGILTEGKELLKDAGIKSYVDTLISSPEQLGSFLADPVESIKPLTYEELSKVSENSISNNEIIIDRSNDIRPSEKADISNDAEVIIPESFESKVTRFRQELKDCAKLLEDSKTLVNSSEYRNLITMTKAAAKGELSGALTGKSLREQFAQELYLVHAATEKYLKHKAADGVKKNVFKKLAAVEKTNKLLGECLKTVGDIELPLNTQLNKHPQRTSELAVSLDERKAAFRQKHGHEDDLPSEKRSYRDYAVECRNNNPQAGNSLADIEGSIRDADVCMCKIMVHAANNMDKPAMRNLSAMRREFLANPFPPEKAPQKAPEAESFKDLVSSL